MKSEYIQLFLNNFSREIFNRKIEMKLKTESNNFYISRIITLDVCVAHNFV